MQGTAVLQAILPSASLWFSGNTTLECSVESIASILPPDTSVNYAGWVPPNGSFGDAATNLLYPMNATQLPELCAVSVNVISSSTSDFNFGLFLPKTWNHRFMGTGNAGFGGGINWPDMGKFVQYGFAAVSTDTGHSSGVFDSTWAKDQPETIIDFGYRAMHGSVELAKQITEAYFGKSIEYSYYAGCSTGGRQGLREVQLYPEDFDGVIAGAPAWWTNHLQLWHVHVGSFNLPQGAGHHITPELFEIVKKEIYRQCDAQDGAEDGILQDPDSCNFFPEALLCSPKSEKGSCLTPAQLDTVYKSYSDYIDANQTFVLPHLSLGADFTSMSIGGEPSVLGTGFLQNFIYNDSTWDWRNYNYQAVQDSDRINAGNCTAWDFDLSSFEARGGKLLMYHGIEDQGIPARKSAFFYKEVFKAMVGKGTVVDDFFRLYLIPGMAHCFGSTNAPWYIGGASQPVPGVSHSVPGYEDAEHDVILAMMQWVEKGVAPEYIVATKYVDEDVSKGVQVQRPVCMYPKQAQYLGGNMMKASSWKCTSLY